MLNALLGADPEEFIAEAWPHQPVVFHGDIDRLDWLEQLPELAQIEAYLSHIGDTDAPALFYFAQHDDEHAAFQLRAAEIADLLRPGAMFSVGGAERWSPELGAPAERLRTELGLPEFTNTRNIVYGSLAGSGVGWHWDAGANFVVQLAGRKVWQIGPNDQVRNPPDRYAMSMHAIPPRLRDIGITEVRAPTSATSVELVAGSVLFLPRGYWHRTRSLDQSLSLNFTFGQPDRVEALARFLRVSLGHDPRWREVGWGGPSGGQEFDRLIAELKVALAGVDSDEILSQVAAQSN